MYIAELNFDHFWHQNMYKNSSETGKRFGTIYHDIIFLWNQTVLWKFKQSLN